MAYIARLSKVTKWGARKSTGWSATRPMEQPPATPEVYAAGFVDHVTAIHSIEFFGHHPAWICWSV